MKFKTKFLIVLLILLLLNLSLVIALDTFQPGPKSASSTSGQQAVYQPQTQQQSQQQLQPGQRVELIPKPVLGCKDGQRCREVDQVWSERLGPLIVGNAMIWDHNRNGPGNYQDTYFEKRIVQDSYPGQQPITSGSQSPTTSYPSYPTTTGTIQQSTGGDCSYCGANIKLLQQIDPGNSCASGGYGSKKCCRGQCPSNAYIQNVPFFSQCDSSLNSLVDTSNSIDQRYLSGGVKQKSTCWRDAKFSSLIDQKFSNYISKLKQTETKKGETVFAHARTMCSSGCGTVSVYMVMKAFKLNVNIYDLFCPNAQYLTYRPGGSGPNTRHDALGMVGLQDKLVDGSTAKSWSFGQYKQLLSQGKAIIVNIAEKGTETAGSNNQMCNGERQTGGHNVVLSGVASSPQGNLYIIQDPGGGDKKCKRTILTENYFKSIIKSGLNVVSGGSGISGGNTYPNQQNNQPSNLGSSFGPSVSCTDTGPKTIIQPGTKPKFAQTLQQYSGKSWLGKLSGNGNRDVAIYIPEGSDCGKSFELIYYFHGTHGYLFGEPVPPGPDAAGKVKSNGVSNSKTAFDQASKLAQDPNRNVIVVYPISGGPRGSPGSTAMKSGYDYYWVDNKNTDSMYTLHNEVMNIIQSQIEPRARISYITVKGHSAGGVPLMNLAGSGFKVDRMDFFDASYGSWAKNAYYSAIKNNPQVQFNIFLIPKERTTTTSTTDTSSTRSIKNKPNVNWIEVDVNHGTVPKKYFDWLPQSSQYNPSTNLASNSNQGTGRVNPSICTYTDRSWQNGGWTNVKPVSKSYSQVSGYEIDPFGSGCTLCQEDQVQVNVAGRTFQICWKYANNVKNALQKMVNAGFVIEDSIKGYSAGRTRDKGATFSQHAYGTAIDINKNKNGLYNKCPSWNPQICKKSAGGVYNPGQVGSITAGSVPYNMMKEIGWKWGGEWSGNQKDFMHFSPSGK